MLGLIILPISYFPHPRVSQYGGAGQHVCAACIPVVFCIFYAESIKITKKKLCRMFFMEIFFVSPTDLWKAWVIASYLQITHIGWS